MSHSFTQNKRPAHLTLAPSSGASSPDIPLTPGAESSEHSQLSILVTGPPSRHHWKPDSEAVHCEYFNCRTWFGLFDRRHHCRKCGDIYCAQHCSNYFRLDQTCQFHPDGILSRGCDKCILDYLARTKMLNARSLLKNQPTTTPSSFIMSPQSTSTQSQRQASSLSPTITTTSISSSLLKKAPFYKQYHGVVTQKLQGMEDVMELGREDISAPIAELPSTKNISINKNHRNKKKNDTVFSPVPSVPADWQWSTF